MKRVIAAVLSICIALCATGCGESYSSADRKAVTTTESKTQTSFTGQSAKQSKTDAVIAMTQAVTETTEETTTSESETFTESETETFTEPETTTFSEPETTTSEQTTTTAKTFANVTPSATTTTKKTAAKPSTTSSQARTTTVTTTKPVQTTTAPKLDKTDTSSKLYYIPKTATVYDKKKNKVGTIAAGCFYSGHYDPNYDGFVVINYLYSEYLVVEGCVRVQKNAKILETAAIGQMGGNIDGKAACGPTAAAILVDYQLGTKWAKDDLIVYCESNKLNDQGNLRTNGGITAPNLMKLIEGYSGGKVKASNVYSSDTSTKLRGLVDKGERSIVVLFSRNGTIIADSTAQTHFVVICGYEYIGGALYFYYADPYFGNGGRSLMRVSAQTLAASMNYVTKEPRCIITVTNNA